MPQICNIEAGVVEPAGIVTLAMGMKIEGLLLVSVIVTPPDGAGAERLVGTQQIAAPRVRR